MVEVKASGPPCLRTVVGLMQGHARCKILLLEESLFFVSVDIQGDHMADTKTRSIWPPSVLPDLKQWCLSVCLALTLGKKM